MTFFIQLSSDEVQKKIPYSMICMTRYGASWNTMRRKRRWLQEFSEHDREAATKLFRQSHDWFLGRGIPKTVKMTMNTYSLWQRIAEFCASI